MDSEKTRDVVGYLGCFVAFMSMGLMFFGVSPAIVGVIIGLIAGLLSLFFDD